MLRSDKYQTKRTSEKASTRAEKQKHKLLQLSRSEAFAMIEQLQHEAFEKKLHSIETTLHRALISALKKEKLKLSQKVQKNGTESKKEKKEGKTEDVFKSQLQTITSLLSVESTLLHDNAKYKIFKVIIQTFPAHLDVKNEKFEGIPTDVVSYMKSMKENNPYKTNSADVNNILSKLYADKNVKSAMESVSALEIIWGPKTYGKNDDELKNYAAEADEGDQNDASSRSDQEVEEISADDNDGKDVELDDEAYEKLYEDYKDYMAGSSDEEEDVGAFHPDPNVNYNEVTDEEEANGSSESDSEDVADSDEETNKRSLEDDDFFTSDSQQTTKKSRPGMKNIQLPSLATGYYSGGESEDENTKDSLVEELTKPRKNRRGQRARQKIWEKKYGSGAKHVVKQQERAKSDRERLRLEFEARQEKRDRKQQEREEREKVRAEKMKKQQEKENKMHPSWEAKIKAQESMKKAKFEGKKITFD
ncbi:hypothetical protein PMKS-001369 [Pichia membranifaciens]|uniref:Bud22 domain-containing protein n=1 Tax=Pichia membranifaciens TaxID=4926 RepID=A0A1Q2YEI7_9ASCO|nr:hypothetical protein PMKS-001369 [Pichia membranifaciens]